MVLPRALSQMANTWAEPRVISMAHTVCPQLARSHLGQTTRPGDHGLGERHENA